MDQVDEHGGRVLRRGRGRTQRARGDRGTALVEFALLTPLFFLIVFGIIDFGTAYNQQHELRSAAREGARLASVDNGCAELNACTGQSADTQRDNLIAATRSRAYGLGNASTIKVSVSFTTTPPKVGDSVVLCLNWTFKSVSGYFPVAQFLDNRALKGRAEIRLEQTPTFSAGTDTGGPGAATC